MKIKFIIDYTNTKHTRVRVFQDGGYSGTLTMDTQAMYTLSSILEACDKEYFTFELEKANGDGS